MKIRVIMKSRYLTQFNWGSFQKIAILLSLANKNKKVVKNKSSFLLQKKRQQEEFPIIFLINLQRISVIVILRAKYGANLVFRSVILFFFKVLLQEFTAGFHTICSKILYDTVHVTFSRQSPTEMEIHGFFLRILTNLEEF